LTAATVDKWGAIPGEFNSVSGAQVNVTTYTADFLSSERLNNALQQQKEGTLNLTETFGVAGPSVPFTFKRDGSKLKILEEKPG
jgi:hypothetical protein